MDCHGSIINFVLNGATEHIFPKKTDKTKHLVFSILLVFIMYIISLKVLHLRSLGPIIARKDYITKQKQYKTKTKIKQCIHYFGTYLIP